MTREQVDSIRSRSCAGGSGPWVSDYVELGRKTVIRNSYDGVKLASIFTPDVPPTVPGHLALALNIEVVGVVRVLAIGRKAGEAGVQLAGFSRRA
jgi:hypothetical protein